MTDNSREVRAEAHSPTASPGEEAAASPAAPDARRPAAPRTLRPRPAGEEPASSPIEDSDAAAEPTADTAAAEENAEEGRPGIDAVGALKAKPLDPVAPTPRPGRPSGPVLAAAAIAGLLLVAAPFTVSAGTQGVSLDIVPLSGGSLLGGDPLNNSQSLTELQTIPLGSSPTGPAVPPAGGAAGPDGNAASDGGGGASADPSSGPGYVPESLDDEGGEFPTGTDDTASGSGTGSGAGSGAGSEAGGNVARHSVSYGDGTNIASGPGSRTPKDEEDGEDEGPSSSGGSANGRGSGSRASEDSDEKGSEESSDPSRSPGGDSGTEDADDGADSTSTEEEDTEEERRTPESAAAGSETDREAPAGESRAEEATAAESSEEAPWSYTATAGPGCASDASYERVGVWHGEGTNGWANRPSGHTADGCDGTYDAIPVSGSADHGNGEYASWSFSPGVAEATCELYVHIPNDESPLWIAEHEARYQIFAGPTADGSPVAGFGIQQSGIRGGWVQATGFVSPNEQFTVQLVNAGENPLADQGTSAHVAASVVRAECS